MKNKGYETIKNAMYPSGLLHAMAVNGKVSGSVYAIGEVEGAVCLIHGAIGCGYHYRYSARTRNSPNFDIVTSNLKQQDIIFSGEDKLETAILQTWEERKPSLIAVIPTPTSDIIQDDMIAVCKRVRNEHGINVICLKSELFSHRDKKYTNKKLAILSAQSVKSPKKLDFDVTGCGYSEALIGLCEIMKPQTVVKKTVNVETIGWGMEGCRLIKEVESLLAKVGVSVNTHFPSATIAEIEKMPRAELNLVMRKHWAECMREKFKTPYLHMVGNGRYSGLDGIENFYNDIANVLDVKEKMKNVLTHEKEKVIQNTKLQLEKIHQKKVYIICGIGALPNKLKLYKNTYNFNVVGATVTLTQTQIRQSEITDEIMANYNRRIKESISMFYPDIQVGYNNSIEEIKELAKEADIIAGTSEHIYEAIGKPILHPREESVDLTFESYVRSVDDIVFAMENSRNHSNLLISKMPYNKEYPQVINKPALIASKELWNKMWIERK